MAGIQEQRKTSSDERESNVLLRLLQTHYTVSPPEKSASQLECEKWLVPFVVRFSRWFLMPAAILIQFCCGSMYAWSVFNKPIDMHIYEHNTNTAPITFYIAIGCFGISAAFFGPLLERRGPRVPCLFGCSFFFLANLVSALGLYLKFMWLVFLGSGVMAGCSLGLCYICPVSCLQKWFPDQKGFAAGFAVCGFGAGAIVISKVQIPLMTGVGLPLTFVTLGSSYFIIMVLCSMVLRTPPNFGKELEEHTAQVSTCSVENILESGKAESGLTCSSGTNCHDGMDEKDYGGARSPSLIECVTSRDFRCMYIMLLANALYGLVVISRLSNMVTDLFHKSPLEASTIVSINGGFNVGGRLLFSIMSDFVGRKTCYFAMLTTQLVIVGSFSTITSTGTYWAFLMTMWILTCCYGGGWGVIPAYLSDRFGAVNIGACHGLILSGWSLGGVCGGLMYTVIFNAALSAGYTIHDPYCYYINAWWIFGVIVTGWITLFFITPSEADLRFRRSVKKFFFKLCRCQSNNKINIAS